LENLNLNSTQITTLPHEIGCLKNLERLDLFETKLTLLPSSIGKLNKLDLLTISNTPIAAQGDETSWGLEELIARFEECVIYK
jgi:Leucine-rich repeat (LRR) protein